MHADVPARALAPQGQQSIQNFGRRQRALGEQCRLPTGGRLFAESLWRARVRMELASRRLAQ